LYFLKSLVLEIVKERAYHMTDSNRPRSGVFYGWYIAGRLSFGWFGDRFDKRRVTAMGMALLGLSMIMFNLVALCWWLVIQRTGRTHSDRQVGAPFLAVSAIYQTPI
jgi:MFS family permease